MSISINEIHYAISINTGVSALSDSTIGLTNGYLNYTTDGYFPTSADTYEDLSPVTGLWYGDLLEKDGVKPSSQSIDLVVGGDMAWASSLSVNIVNYDELHKKILTTDDVYVVGCPMSMYVIIDNVWYTRWTGVVAEVQFSDNSFSFIGKDKQNADNVNLSSYIFGTTPTATIPISEDLSDKRVITNIPINRYYFTNDTLTSYCQKHIPDAAPSGDVVTRMQKQYNGLCFDELYTTTTNNSSYVIQLVGVFPNVKAGMYLQINSENEMFYITRVDVGSIIIDTGATLPTCLITVDGDIPKLLDTAQLYGVVPKGVPTAVKTEMDKFTEETLTCSVYDKGVVLKPITGGYKIYDGNKLDVITKEGDHITVKVKENNDGTVTVLNKVYAAIYKPKTVKYFSSSTETLKNEILAGTAKNLEDYFLSQTITVPNDFDISSVNDYNYFITNADRYHYFLLEFEDTVAEGTPFVVVNSLADSTEVWSWETFDGQDGPEWWNALYGKDIPYNTYRTVYNSPYVNNDVASLNSRFRGYLTSTFRIINDGFYGYVPFLVDDFLLPNVRSSDNVFSLDSSNKYWSTTTRSINSTNVPYDSIIGDNIISIRDGFRSWDYTVDPTFYVYPNGKVKDFDRIGSSVKFNKDNTKELKAQSNKILMIIEADNPEDINLTEDTENNFYIRSLMGDTKYSIDWTKMKFGLNSIGLYKEITVESSADIMVKTDIKTTNTVQKLISDLTGRYIDLPNRTNWFVGGQIADDNKYTILTNICKQSFTAGYCDRFGEYQYTNFLED